MDVPAASSFRSSSSPYDMSRRFLGLTEEAPFLSGAQVDLSRFMAIAVPRLVSEHLRDLEKTFGPLRLHRGVSTTATALTSLRDSRLVVGTKRDIAWLGFISVTELHILILHTPYE